MNLSLKSKKSVLAAVCLLLVVLPLTYGYVAWPRTWRTWTVVNGGTWRINGYTGKKEGKVGDTWFAEDILRTPDEIKQNPYNPPAGR